MTSADKTYANAAQPLLGRALSYLDWETTSASHGSFDRTWWCWKFTDFSATRFQEGAYTIAWLLTSPNAPVELARQDRLLSGARASMNFWATLQHGDGSFDEAYPFERSLAATAFTGFYVGSAFEKLRASFSNDQAANIEQALAGASRWLDKNGEFHGILSNHLAAAAGALQVAGDVLGTDRFNQARDRYLDIIYKEQHDEEGWLNEYGGADPGYQSHAMFYMAEIERRTGNTELFERLKRASDFLAWFLHPDGSLGGEYASRGTKFCYPAAFEMLSERVPSAAALALGARKHLTEGRGVAAREMDAWNTFPMLNNLLFAADATTPIDQAGELPWQKDGATAVFPDAGLVVANRKGRVLAAGGHAGGAVKVWNNSGLLIYEDCGYAVEEKTGKWAVSQGPSTSKTSIGKTLTIDVNTLFQGIKRTRFDPWRFLAFRGFSITVGRSALVARHLKDLLVEVLIRRKPKHQGRLSRTILFEEDGKLMIEDLLTGLNKTPQAIERNLPYHMGSSRYADVIDATGAEIGCPPPEPKSGSEFRRLFTLPPVS